MTNNYYKKKKKKKSFKKKHVKGTKIFRRRKNKNCQYACEQYRNLSEEEKEKKHHYDCEW